MLVVVWRITERCNLGCDFCAYSRALGRSRQNAETEEVRRFGRLLQEFRQVTGRRVLMSWLGGEPLLWPQLTELSEYFTTELGLALSTTTNGTALGSPSISRLLANHFSELTVSIDGLAEFHDHVRHAPGLFAALRENVHRFAALHAGTLLRANTVLMRGNIADYPALGRELAGWGFRELTFNQLGGNDRPEFFPENRLLPSQIETFAAVLPPLRAEMAARGVTVRGSAAYLHRLEATARGERLPMPDCAPGQRFLFIDEHGVVSPCSFTTAGYGVPIAEIRDLADLQALPERFATLRRAQCLAPCLDCHSTQVFEKFQSNS